MSRGDLEGRPGERRTPEAGGGEPRYVSFRPGALAVNQLPAYSFEVEQYRNLSLQIEEAFDSGDESQVLAVVGPDPHSGKTLTSLNVALILARRTERKVLLVEGDLWRPSFGKIFQVPTGARGVADLLEDPSLTLEDALLSVWGTRLSILTGGERAGEGDLVISKRMDELIEEMKERFDLVVFDTPPIGLASGRYLTGFAQNVVVVVRASQTHERSIAEALESLEPRKVVGLVLNDVRKRKRNYAYYSSYVAYYGGEYGSKPVGWTKRFWRRPLAGLASVGTVLGAVVASAFAIARGKPAEAELEPAWIVAGVLLMLTIASWTFALGKRSASDDSVDSPVANFTIEDELAGERPTASAEGESATSPSSLAAAAFADVEETDDPALEMTLVDEVDHSSEALGSSSLGRGTTIANLNLRAQPALDGDYINTLQRGTAFEVLEQADDWYRVRAGDQEGWVASLGVELGIQAGAEDVPSAESGNLAGSPPGSDGGAMPTTAARLNLRAQPGLDGEYLTTLPEGTTLELLGLRDGWYRVRADGQVGWVTKTGVREPIGFDPAQIESEPESESEAESESEPEAEAEAAPPTPAADGARTNTNLNLRSEPGRLGGYLTTLPEGTNLEVLEERDDWYRVRASGRSGWVFKLGVDKPGLPAPEPEPSDRSSATAASPAGPTLSWVPPKFLSWAAPSPSAEGARWGFGETLVVAVRVSETGAVLEASLEGESVTDAAFEDAVLESMRSAIFRPAFRDGIPVEAVHTVRVKYQE